MHQRPVPSIAGAQPRTGIRKNQLPNRQSDRVKELSEQYLETRNRQILNRARESELSLARARNELIEKSLVVKQASYLFVAMRQRALGIPDQYARRMLSISDPQEARQILREAMFSLLNELKNLPDCVEEGWLAKAEEQEKREARRES